MNRFPLFRCLVFFVLGIILANNLIINTDHIYLLCAVSSILISFLIYRHKNRVYEYLIPLGFFLFGFVHYQLQSPNIVILSGEEINRETAYFQVKIIEKGKQNKHGIKQKASIVASSIANTPNHTVLLELKSQNAPKIGDLIEVKGKLFPLPPPALPGQFDYANYLRSQGISSQLKSNKWVLIRKNSHFSIKAIAADCQYYLFQKLKKGLKDKDAIGLAAAVLLGYKDVLDPTLKKAFQQAGAIHMLAVSGMHTGILYMVLCFLLRINNGRNTSQIFRKCLILILLWFFALLTGFNPGVVRACTMFSLIIFSGIINRNNELFHHLCLSCMLMLLYDSHWLYDIGFQLSYAALTGIALLQKPLESCIKTRFKPIQYLVSLITVSIAAQIACLPFLLYYFHTFPTYFLISNLLLLPFLPLLVYGGMLLLFLDMFSVNMNLIHNSYESILIYFNKAVIFIASMPVSSTKPLYPSLSQSIALALLICLSSYVLIHKRFQLIKYVLYAFFFIQSEELYQNWQLQNKHYLLLHNNRSASFYFIANGHAYTNKPAKNLYEKKQIHQFFEAKHIKISKESETNIVSDNTYMSTANYCFFWLKKNENMSVYNTDKKNVIILSKNSKVDTMHFHSNAIEMILADGSNAYEKIQEWESYCNKHNIPFYAAKKKFVWIKLD